MKHTLFAFVMAGLLGVGQGAFGCEEGVAMGDLSTREGILQAIAKMLEDAPDLRWKPLHRRFRTLAIVDATERLYPPPAWYRPGAWAGTPPGMTEADARLFAATAQLRSWGLAEHHIEYITPWLRYLAESLQNRT